MVLSSLEKTRLMLKMTAFRWEGLSVILYSYFPTGTDLLLSPKNNTALTRNGHTNSTLRSLKRDFLCNWSCCFSPCSAVLLLFNLQPIGLLSTRPKGSWFQLLLSGSFGGFFLEEVSIWSQETGSLFYPSGSSAGREVDLKPSLSLLLSSSWGQGPDFIARIGVFSLIGQRKHTVLPF